MDASLRRHFADNVGLTPSPLPLGCEYGEVLSVNSPPLRRPIAVRVFAAFPTSHGVVWSSCAIRR